MRDNRRMKILLLPVAAAVLAAGTACAQMAPVPAAPRPTGNCTHPDASTRPDCKQAIAFLATLQDALKANKPQAVAALVHYPLLVTAGRRRKVPSQAALLADYPSVFTAQIRAAILNATPDDVWGNDRGFMIGRGTIWFDSIGPGKSFRLITVNPVY